MVVLTEVPVGARSLEPLASVVGEEVVRETETALTTLSGRLAGRVLWNINSTARGGGVAEMLQSLLAYARGAGVDARWLTVGGDDRFFRITKRLHHALHGGNGDGMPLGDAERRHYEAVLHVNAEELLAQVQASDVVLLHDPQTAGLIAPLAHRGCKVIWRCHIGHDRVDQEVERGWAFIRPYLQAHAYVFSRDSYVPAFLREQLCRVVAPCIDPLSPKNQPLDEPVVRAILTHTGLLEGPEPEAPRNFKREDGTVGRVDRCADVIRLGPAPGWRVPLVVQVSRWDTLKDPLGVLRGFSLLSDGQAAGAANLVLAGPNVHAVADDPEGAEVFDAVLAAWRGLPHGTRQRVHLVNLPMADVEENAAIVNALQRHATIVVQKSLHEGFGLTVAEAMWKSRPVLASAVGGIVDQIEDGESGVLLEDPEDFKAFADAVARLLEDADLRARLGPRARRRVAEQYLCNRHFREYAALLLELEREPARG